jgi:Fur family iron response transcriptional regulator
MLYCPPPATLSEQAEHRCRARLRSAGLRPTRQRMSIVMALFARDGERHVTADDIFAELQAGPVSLSLATVYNALNQFADAGLVGRLAVNGERTYFDTDASDHCHFYVEAEDRIIDISPEQMQIAALPSPPDGYEIAKIDVVVRLRRRQH